MTLKELLQNNTWATISTRFLEIYPEAEKDMEGYETVFDKLGAMTPEEIDMSIVISHEKDDDEEYIDVSGLYNNPRNEEENFSQAIEFTPWREWLGMDISRDSLNDFSELEIIVHCLYEMTFVSFAEEDIQKVLNRAKKSKEDFESMTKEEKNVSTTTLEELLNEWSEEDSDESKQE